MKQVVLMSVFSLLLFTGCHNYGGGVTVRGGYPYSQPIPPAHAPAHGRRHHLYHYYPNAEFYFDVGRNMYFYLDTRGQWSFSVNLPHHLRGFLHNDFVEFEMENDRPYLRHEYHRNKYKKHKYKHKYKSKQKYKYNKKKHHHKPDSFLGGEDEGSRRKKGKYKNEDNRRKKDRYENKDDRRKKGRYEDEDDRRKKDKYEDDDERHKKGRGFLGN